VLLVGRLDAEKGTAALLDLWRDVDSGLELRVIGDGPDRPALEAMRVDNVRFLGWMDSEQLRQEMLAARGLVFPSSLMETFGLSIAEAFAAGMPVVANDLGTRPEVVGRDGSGYLVKDRSEWKEALVKLADDATVDQAGTAARRRYLDLFDPVVTLPQLLKVYEELVAIPRS
jgi:glycosyltransferase involved in cell wall biosynthesis